VARAAAWIGVPHRVGGRVVRGDARGRTLGFPTANLDPDGGMLPADGVYAVRTDTQDGRHDAVAHLGARPTFAGVAWRFEVHLLDGVHQLDGTQLDVAFVQRLREIRRFDGPDALVAQIRADIDAARTALAR
jgi:riboflavin kinase/FMN adenylyltransferase